mgnify:CR=1 FL=1
MRTLSVLPVALLVALAAGCTGGQDDAAPQPAPSTVAGSPPPWSEPADYTYVVERRCEGKPSMGTYEVTVAGGEVAALKRTDGKTASGEEEIDLPTLGGLVELAQTASDDGGQMSVTSSADDGHPVEVSFDVSEGATNEDNTCFHVTAYTPAS